MTPTSWRRLAAAAAACGTLALSGCDATVATDIRVTGPDQAVVRVSAVFTDEAAAAIRENKQARTQLLGIFSDRTGHAPQVSQSGDRIEVSDDLTYEQLTGVSDLVGIGKVTLVPGGHDESVLEVTVATPTKLAEAVAAANAGQPDAAALTATMLASTHVDVRVTFPGGVHEVHGTPADLGVTVDGDTATYARTADSTEVGTFSVTGDPTPDRWPYLAGGGALAAAGVLVWRRRRPTH